MSSGSFDINGMEFAYEILSIETYNGDEFTGSEIDEHIEEADRVFYQAQATNGETYYRWLGGPFQSIDDVGLGIQDEMEEYYE